MFWFVFVLFLQITPTARYVKRQKMIEKHQGDIVKLVFQLLSFELTRVYSICIRRSYNKKSIWNLIFYRLRPTVMKAWNARLWLKQLLWIINSLQVAGRLDNILALLFGICQLQESSFAALINVLFWAHSVRMNYKPITHSIITTRYVLGQ